MIFDGTLCYLFCVFPKFHPVSVNNGHCCCAVRARASQLIHTCTHTHAHVLHIPPATIDRERMRACAAHHDDIHSTSERQIARCGLCVFVRSFVSFRCYRHSPHEHRLPFKQLSRLLLVCDYNIQRSVLRNPCIKIGNTIF